MLNVRIDEMIGLQGELSGSLIILSIGHFEGPTEVQLNSSWKIVSL